MIEKKEWSDSNDINKKMRKSSEKGKRVPLPREANSSFSLPHSCWSVWSLTSGQILKWLKCNPFLLPLRSGSLYDMISWFDRPLMHIHTSFFLKLALFQHALLQNVHHEDRRGNIRWRSLREKQFLSWGKSSSCSEERKWMKGQRMGWKGHSYYGEKVRPWLRYCKKGKSSRKFSLCFASVRVSRSSLWGEETQARSLQLSLSCKERGWEGWRERERRWGSGTNTRVLLDLTRSWRVLLASSPILVLLSSLEIYGQAHQGLRINSDDAWKKVQREDRNQGPAVGEEQFLLLALGYLSHCCWLVLSPDRLSAQGLLLLHITSEPSPSPHHFCSSHYNSSFGFSMNGWDVDKRKGKNTVSKSCSRQRTPAEAEAAAVLLLLWIMMIAARFDGWLWWSVRRIRMESKSSATFYRFEWWWTIEKWKTS